MLANNRIGVLCNTDPDDNADDEESQQKSKDKKSNDDTPSGGWNGTNA